MVGSRIGRSGNGRVRNGRSRNGTSSIQYPLNMVMGGGGGVERKENSSALVWTSIEWDRRRRFFEF